MFFDESIFMNVFYACFLLNEGRASFKPSPQLTTDSIAPARKGWD
jgi:hypothetical protein